MYSYGTNGSSGGGFGSTHGHEDDMDDLYGGFGGDPSSMREPSHDAFAAPQFSGPPSTSMGRSNFTRGMTAMGGNSSGGVEARPMTSVKGAGYQSQPQSKTFDPLNQGPDRGPAPQLAENMEKTPEARAKEMERVVNSLIEASAEAASHKEYLAALEKAKEAGKKERQLRKLRESSGLQEQMNLDLTYSVCFTLANAYQHNEMHAEALKTYSLIVKNKQYHQSGRLRVNMGNIYYDQDKFTMAIKMYRMALDQIPNTARVMRYRIMRNIGNAFVRLAQYQDAVQSFESIMEGDPDFQTAFNLVVCYFALGNTEAMRKSFQRLIQIPIMSSSNEDEDLFGEIEGKEAGLRTADDLEVELREREKKARTYILNAAKLIAPVINRRDWVAGYDELIEDLSHDHSLIASEMEINKATEYLRHKQFGKAIEVLKAFEKKDPELRAKASTNLSFLYFLEGDLASADKYANLAVRSDRYNARALVNKGNCMFANDEPERAKELYLEAIGVEADCAEAIFNLGITNKKLGNLPEAMQAFEKLHSIVPNSPEVIYQIGSLYDETGNLRAATKWFNILVTRVPTDPGVLSRLGQIFNKDEDESQAFHYHYESYRFYPVNLDVISWLGVWYVKSELYEKAIEFFERASQIQPHEVKWRLMVTSCYRRMGTYQKAFELYEEIHRDYPDNLECLRYLVAICKDLGVQYGQYQTKLAKLERTYSSGGGAGGGGQLTQVAGMGTGQRAMHGGYAEPRRREKIAMDAIGEEEESTDDLPKHTIKHTIGEPEEKKLLSTKVDVSDEWADADLDDLLAD